MTFRSFAKANASFLAESAMLMLIVVAYVQVVRFLLSAGALPPPFFYDTFDTFMDWANTAYWSHHAGAYSIWQSVYPPLSFDFLRVLTIPSCYAEDSIFGRDCDYLGRISLFSFFFVNFVVVFLCYRDTVEPRRVWLRTIVMCAGLPMAFALERGNLIVPCFTFFALGYGRVLRSARLRWIAVAFTINFKPYLVATLLPQIFRRRWRWVEGAIFATIIVYLISYFLEGVGTPWEVIHDIITFSQPETGFAFSQSTYASSFSAALTLLKSAFPVIIFLGSRPIELMQTFFPLAIRLGELGVLACFLSTLWAPRAISVARLSALGTAVALTATNPGGYTEVFLLFFVFQEPWRGVPLIVTLVAAYLVCVPWDYPLFRVSHDVGTSWLTNRTVGYDIVIGVGELVRPALLLVIEYGLVAASLIDVAREFRRRRNWRLADSPSAGTIEGGAGAPA